MWCLNFFVVFVLKMCLAGNCLPKFHFYKIFQISTGRMASVASQTTMVLNVLAWWNRDENSMGKGVKLKSLGEWVVSGTGHYGEDRSQTGYAPVQLHLAAQPSLCTCQNPGEETCAGEMGVWNVWGSVLFGGGLDTGGETGIRLVMHQSNYI